MKNVYIKTTWVDNKTPINAANLNKIENAISDLYTNALSVSEITQGDGIKIATTSEKLLEISVTDKVMQSESCGGVEVVQGEQVNYEKGKLYFVLDTDTKKLKKIIVNGVPIYEVE